ncbi:NUDIX domain-containing protein [Stenotrophomonas sp. 278]|uniref:NUDIX hydrolase n=1 Tax=Stenotrophomonas sp. 278 TaxID=2479851 RepID=UPI000F6707BC|nr:NUDIX domain-containing protein [Stenotrophomonas sp. 278]RRU14933.1 NUDIX domain-containing protein [Stenotrophomonas sp. 278]
MSPNVIQIAAAVISRDDGKVLVVRKKGSHAFIQPGGKIEPGEDPIQALCRELDEELGLTIAPTLPTFIGTFSAPAVNERGSIVTAQVYTFSHTGEVHPKAELEEIVWIDPKNPGDLELAPLTRDHIFRASALR